MGGQIMHVIHCLELIKVFAMIKSNRVLDEEEYLMYKSCLEYVRVTNEDALRAYYDAKKEEPGNEDEFGSGVPRD